MEEKSWCIADDKVIRNVNEHVVHFEFDPKIAKLIKLSYVACLNLIKKEENPDYFRFTGVIFGAPPAAFVVNDLWQNKYIYFDQTLCMIGEGRFLPNVAFILTEESYTNIYGNVFNLFEQLDKLVEKTIS